MTFMYSHAQFQTHLQLYMLFFKGMLQKKISVYFFPLILLRGKQCITQSCQVVMQIIMAWHCMLGGLLWVYSSVETSLNTLGRPVSFPAYQQGKIWELQARSCRVPFVTVGKSSLISDVEETDAKLMCLIWGLWNNSNDLSRSCGGKK